MKKLPVFSFNKIYVRKDIASYYIMEDVGNGLNDHEYDGFRVFPFIIYLICTSDMWFDFISDDVIRSIILNTF